MASTSSIRRLDAATSVLPIGNTKPAQAQQAEVPEPDLLALYVRSLTTRPRRFSLPGGEARFGSPALMGACAPTDIPMSRATFGDVAMRESVQQAREAAMRRIATQGRSGANRQHADVRFQF
jgi:hypothetical protein